LARLDALQQAYYDRALKGDIEAAEICIDIIGRRARLLGLTRAIKRAAPAAKRASRPTTSARPRPEGATLYQHTTRYTRLSAAPFEDFCR
jgi:hypothetical protein